MLRLWHVMLLTSLASSCSAGDSSMGDGPEPGVAEISVLHYDYQFDMATLRATAKLSLRVDTEGDCFSLPMRAQGLEEVSIDGEPPISADYQTGTAKLCGAGWIAGSEIELQVSTTVPAETWGDSQVGYSVRTDIEGTDFSYLVSWVGGCDRFGPCDSRPSVFATYRLTVDHPSGTQVLCPGTITAGDTQTICDFPFDGGPSYSSFGFAASPSWVKVDLGDWGGISATLYDLPTADLAGKLDIDEHRNFTAWMVERFGPYPYGSELRFATAPTYWNGFEHPGNIVLNEQLKSSGFNAAYTNPLAHTVSHEIAHQWAGDQTTLAGTYDFVWKEAMAEYLVYVHKDEEVSVPRARKTLTAWLGFSRNSEYYLVPGEAPPLLDYYGDVYGPGPMILFKQIEALFGRASVMQALAELLGQARAIGVSDVQLALEETTGADLGAYFEAWVYGEGTPHWPQFAITTEASGNDTVVQVNQESPELGLFGCAFDVALDGADVDQELRVRVNLGPDGMATWSTTVTPEFAVTGFRYDPDHECLGTLATSQARALPRDPAYQQPWVAPAYRRAAP